MTVAAHKRAICCATRQTDSEERRATAYSSQNCVPTDKSQKNWTACRFEYGHAIYHVHQSRSSAGPTVKHSRWESVNYASTNNRLNGRIAMTQRATAQRRYH